MISGSMEADLVVQYLVRGRLRLGEALARGTFATRFVGWLCRRSAVSPGPRSSHNS